MTLSDDNSREGLTRNEWLGITNPDDDESEAVVISAGHSKMGYFLSFSLLASALEINVHGPSPFLLDAEERHKVAALCLYGQPFGFSAEDVALLETAAARHEAEANRPSRDDIDDFNRPNRDEIRSVAARYASLASRIAALLPPEKE